MKQRSDLLDRAAMTMERTALALRDLREELDAAAGPDSRGQHHLWDAVTDLEWRHSLLSDLYLDMMLSPPSELGERWQTFSVCYDDYREAVREVRSGLMRAGGSRARAPGAAYPHPPAAP